MEVRKTKNISFFFKCKNQQGDLRSDPLIPNFLLVLISLVPLVSAGGRMDVPWRQETHGKTSHPRHIDNYASVDKSRTYVRQATVTVPELRSQSHTSFISRLAIALFSFWWNTHQVLKSLNFHLTYIEEKAMPYWFHTCKLEALSCWQLNPWLSLQVNWFQISASTIDWCSIGGPGLIHN